MTSNTQVDVPALLALGLDEQLAQVWTAMAAAPGIGVSDLVGLLGIGESQVREHLDALADRALIRVSQQTPGLLLPIAPEAVVAQLLRRQEEELAEQQRRIQAQREQIANAVSARLDVAGHTPDPQVEHIVGPDANHARFEQLAYGTTTSIESIVQVASLPAEMLRDAWPLDADLLRRGVAVRALYLEAIRNDPPLNGYARKLETHGAQVRTSPTLPQRLFVSDRRVAVVPLDPTSHTGGIAVVSAPGVVASLLELFESVWRNAAPLDVGNPVDAATGLSDTERTLLTMLADGATDETAAKKLGVSLRTVRRIMADLMQRLEAGSRFEAGIKAAKRGWL